MDMKINAKSIVECRKEKAWSQQHLADVSGLSLRTVQRMENTSSGAPDSVKAIAMAFGLVPADLMKSKELDEESYSQSKNTRSFVSSKKPLVTMAGIVAFLVLGTSLWLLAGPSSNVIHANQDPSLVQSDTSIEKQRIVEEATLAWLKLVDGGDYALSWTLSDSLIREQVTSAQWQYLVSQARTLVGNNIHRKLSSLELSASLPSLPDGQYAMVVFRSKFEKKADTFETLPMSKASGKWRPIGYFIR